MLHRLLPSIQLNKAWRFSWAISPDTSTAALATLRSMPWRKRSPSWNHTAADGGFVPLTSSGMPTISTPAALPASKAETVYHPGQPLRRHHGSFRDVLQPLNIRFHAANLIRLEAEQLLKEHKDIRLLYYETPANPTLDCFDMDALAELGHKYNCIVVADNTFATPYLQQPFQARRFRNSFHHQIPQRAREFDRRCHRRKRQST